MRNDCFAMPQGAYWTPVDDALAHLRANLQTVTGTKEISLRKAAGRVLAEPALAKRSHPPTANTAVDGYGFSGPVEGGVNTFTLIDGRAAAGQPFQSKVPQGHAIRILTGAALPTGVNTVVLQEDVAVDGRTLSFHGPIKVGANTRAAGEDMIAGQEILRSGRLITPADVGMLAAAGVGTVHVRKRLRVGVLSTGDELAQPGHPARSDQIFDANGPMLAAIVKRWGYKLIDLGCAPDDPDQLRKIMSKAAKCCDVILSSGGASAGDEDHMSALLADTGSFALWRIAMKPGRPLVMGLWKGKPVLGLPGNPVAAMVCSLIFARPMLSVLAGSGWVSPQSLPIKAAFTKTKKAGRREFLRARLVNGQIEIFPSEGSGRVSGLSWATGLVELPDHAMAVEHGDTVTYYPYTAFDL